MAFPADPLPILVELYVGTWIDITADVRQGVADSGGGIAIKRGRSAEGQQTEPGSCSLVLNNGASLAAPGVVGRYSPRNPRSDLYGRIGRNTPVRVSVGGDMRFHGEISTWPPRWNLAGTDAWVPVEAAGILRRLRQGAKAVKSPLRRTIEASGPVAYWPVEDGPLSGQVASVLSRGTPLTITGATEFVTPEDVALTTTTIHYGTSVLANLAGGGKLLATLPADATAATATGWTVAMTAQIPGSAAISGDVVLLEVATPGGTFARWQLRARKATSETQVVAITSGGAETVVINAPGITTSFQLYDVSVWQDGGTIQVGLGWSSFNGVFDRTGSVAGTLAGATAVTVNATGATATTPMPAGHVAVWATHPLPVEDFPVDANGNVSFGALQSYRLEAAHVRLARLCAEDGVPLSIPAVPASGAVLMGYQRPGSWQSLVDECVAADGGILYEARDSLGLVCAPRHSLYNRSPVALTYQHLSPPLDPVDDDAAVRNDVEVKRKDGSSARAVLRSGPLSVLPPPDGVGVYDESVELVLSDDTTLPDRAGWLLHLGTVDEGRYPQLHVNLASPIWAGDPSLTAQITALDSGDVINVDGLPEWLPARLKVMVQGYQETLDAYQRDIVFNGTPGSAWDVGEFGASRYDTAGSGLAAAGATDTSLTATTVAGSLWTEDPGMLPLDLDIGGEQVRATAINRFAVDLFGRTTSGEWGDAGPGLPWAISQGFPSEVSVNGSQGLIRLAALNAERHMTINLGVLTQDVRTWCTLPVTPTGAGINWGLLLRYVDPSNYYWIDAQVGTDSSITLRLIKRVGGASAQITTTVPGTVHSTTTPRALRADIRVSMIRARLWSTDVAEPTGWDLTYTDPAPLTGTRAGVVARLMNGNTNPTPVEFRFDNVVVANPQRLTVARSINGVVKSHPAGTPVRLWTPAVYAL